MEKKRHNTELIAFRVHKTLKRKYDEYCMENGLGLAESLRCHMMTVTGEKGEESALEKPS